MVKDLDTVKRQRLRELASEPHGEPKPVLWNRIHKPPLRVLLVALCPESMKVLEKAEIPSWLGGFNSLWPLKTVEQCLVLGNESNACATNKRCIITFIPNR